MTTITHTLAAGVVLVAHIPGPWHRTQVRESLARYGYLIGIDETVTPAQWVQRIRAVHAPCKTRDMHCRAIVEALC